MKAFFSCFKSRQHFVLLFCIASSCWAADPKIGDLYLGNFNVYQRTEEHLSIFGGRVTMLEPGGYDPLLDSAWAILIEGVISEETPRLVDTLLKHQAGVRMIFFDSPGGDLFGGIALGKTISRGDLQTIVNRGAECESACALAFLGGRSRYVLTDAAKFGFHRQYYVKDGQISYGSWAKDLATIRGYLTAIGTSKISAEEIVNTTGIATYSQARLRDLEVTTESSSQVEASTEEHIARTGLSYSELVAGGCTLHSLSGAVTPCQGPWPFRLPAVLVWYRAHPAALGAVKAATFKAHDDRLAQARKFSDLNRINCTEMNSEWIQYLQKRLDEIGRAGSPENVAKSYRDKAQLIADACWQQLKQKEH
jgi:hypothetical protein